MRHNVLLLAAFLSFATPVMAGEAFTRILPQAKIVGSGKLTFAFWDIYEATLYAPRGILKPDITIALSLEYKRAFSGKDIASRSVEEMRGQGFSDEARLAVWQKEMERIFPDVSEGTVLSALFIPGGATTFYHDDQLIGAVMDTEFTRQFSAIWLGEKTSEPELRKKLLGLS
jgi:Chalcone isomerase-like